MTNAWSTNASSTDAPSSPDARSPEPAPKRRRGSARAAAERRRGGLGRADAGRWRIPRRLDPPTDPLSAEQLEKVMDAAYRVLETIGVEYLLPEALDILDAAGASVDRDARRARIGRDIVQAAMASAPAHFEIVPRNPARALPIGGDAMVVAPVASAPNSSDRRGGRRAGSREDFQRLLKLSQHFECIHTIGGYPVEPIDLPPSIRALEATRDILTITDKAPHIYSLGPEMVEDGMEMTRLAAGLDEETFRARPRVYTNVNTNSPLRIDAPMMDGPLRMARRGQATIITPFTLAGAMAPISLAGAAVQQTAEFLAAATVVQLAAPGAPVVLGGFVSNVDMRSGAPVFGTPEYMRGAQLGGQIARRLGVPYRSSNVNAANAVDPQSTWESVFSLWAAISAGAHYIHHGAGWLEGGLVASFEKFVIDCQLLDAIYAYLEPIELTDDALGLEAMAEVGPGGHFFGCAHTQARFETAFHHPFLSDWRTFQNWTQDGARTAVDRAETIYQTVLAEFDAPPMDDAARGALDAFVERRVQEGGAAPDA